ncbi:MAG: hypothetical protein LBO77_06975 [Desulfovibrio sp.]|jgi:hypothetical protein|nr:hypothetical protein [Desulfovibrio sp.]
MARCITATTFLVCSLFAGFSGGCASRVPTDEIRAAILSGEVDDLEKRLEETHEEYSEMVTALNLARVRQMDGRWADSARAFDEALAILEEYESRALVNIRALASGAGTFLLSRGAESYFGAGYERSLLHTFNALNYLMLGDIPGAAAEIRRMEQRQAFWLEESQARIEKILENKEKVYDSPEELPQGYSMREILSDEAVRGLVNNYQDAFSYALGAVLLRLAGDLQAAGVNMRRAMTLDDKAGRFFEQAWPAAAGGASLKRRDVPPLPGKRPDAVSPAGKRTRKRPDTQEVTIIGFTGLAPSLGVENVRIWVPVVGHILIDLPAYTQRAVPGSTLLASGPARKQIALHPLLRTDLLAYRTLWDSMRAEAGFAVSRAVSRAGIAAGAYLVAKSNSATRDYAEIIGSLTMLFLDLTAQSMSSSVRNWETLPNTGYLAGTRVPRGAEVTIASGGSEQRIILPEEAQGIIILATEMSAANLKVYHVTY